MKKRILLIVYVDDIMITRDDTKGTDSLKYLQKHFQTKDLGSLKYFLRIEVATSKKGYSFIWEEVCTWLAFGG